MSEENMEDMIKPQRNFVDYHVLPDIIWHCLINDSIPKKVIYIYIYIYIYFLDTKSMAKRFKYRFYIR